MESVIHFLLPLLSLLPTAHYFYPETYSVEISKKELQAIATPTFSTHQSKVCEKLHWFNEHVVLLPFRLFIHSQAYLVQPFPGGEKSDSKSHLAFKKAIASAGCFFTAMPALHSLAFGMGLRTLLHTDRPFMQYLYTPKESANLTLKKENPLHLATHNVSFTPSSVNIKMDMRPPIERALELAHSILENPKPPQILIIEEGWHEGALKVFCNSLKKIYPHIFHSIAPSFLGMSSGIALFSRFEIEDVKFVKFEKMPPPHNLPPRGILRIHLKTDSGPLYVYGGIHTHSMTGFVSAQARMWQLKQLHEFVAADAQGHHQIIMGDMNTTHIDMFGHDNSNQPEGFVWNHLQQSFTDLFLLDHDPKTGHRKKGEPYFLKSDNAQMGLNLEEPCASWYDGPFLREDERREVLAEMEEDATDFGYPLPKVVKNTSTVSWGTPQWFFEQNASCARLDAILIPKNSKLTGKAEIRRIVMKKGSLSPSSDHLPVHALIWIK